MIGAIKDINLQRADKKIKRDRVKQKKRNSSLGKEEVEMMIMMIDKIKKDRD